ncbi:DUF63 family protein [Halobellus litoreus]|uniref:DUF63 family protein n=1 Tax=Halobellus litoreus TaxID=755310 RepID=A0ABD6E3Z3_9EURY|nr:DUF63 family protein [Halobellus litoreus]
MSTVAERVGVAPERLWAGGVAGALVALVAGALLFPETVYDGFIWHYFWGPVQADANSAVCAVRPGSTVQYIYDSGACANAAEPVAYPGYTLVSEVGYMVTLLVALIGVVFLLRRLDLGTDRKFFYALVPFVFFGGALRVVEDANDAVPAAEALISYPLNTLFISPIIYFTVFAMTLVAVVAAVWAARAGIVERYDRLLFGIGWAVLFATLAYLFWLVLTGAEGVEFYPQVLGVVLLGSTLAAGISWVLIERFAPTVNEGTRWIGFVILWGHAVDGVANVVGLDWMPALGAGRNLIPKHPVNEFVVNVTGSVLPPSILAVTGDTWPFLVVKLLAATFVLWVFEEEIFEESPRYTMLLLVAVLAVGLGPGTRDMLRATFGV